LLVIAAVAITMPVGYFFFWGPANVRFMTSFLGPFYYVPLLIPAVLAGARGMARLARWSQPLGVAALVAMLACSGAVTERAIRANLRQTTVPRVIEKPFEDVQLDNAVVFLPGETLLNPFGFARNQSSFDGPVIWSRDLKGGNFRVLDRFAGRTPYALRLPAVFGGESPAGEQQTLELEKLQVLRASAVEWPISAQNRADLAVVRLEVKVGRRGTEVALVDRRSSTGKVHDVVVRLDEDGVSFTAGNGDPVAVGVRPGDSGVLRVALTATDPLGSSSRTMASFSATYRVVAGELEVLASTEPFGAVGRPRTSGRSS
jgi:hypothetical protein